jgi:hypothetical protein
MMTWRRFGIDGAPRIQPYVKQLLLDNIRKEPGPMPDECWIWTGNAMPNGYGMVAYRGKSELAHRVAYRVFVEDFSKEFQINHLCHVRLCINPSHLYVGTQQDNIDDMWQAGRANPRKVLTDQQVAEALQMLQEGRSQMDVARHFGVSDGAIHAIARGHTRCSVPGPRPKKHTYSKQYKGVWFDDSQRCKWTARLKVKGQKLYLGSFGFKADAAICWNYHVAYLGLDRPLNEISADEMYHD